MTENIIFVDPIVVDLLPRYLDNRREDIKTLKKAMDENDMEIIVGLGHKIKGSGASYGLQQISDFGLQLETAAKNRDHKQLSETSHEFETFLECVQIEQQRQ